MDLFESLGVALKVERGRRVFPVSDKAAEVRQALLDYAAGADLVYDGAASLLLEPLETEPPPGKKKGPACRCVGVRGVSGRRYPADCVLVATGGVSYPGTGSTGDGYKLARQAGHTIVEPVPSLVSLVSSDPDCKKMMGLALKNVVLTLYEDDKAIFSEQGEMLFTHFGISGPLTLSASSHLGDMDRHRYRAEIDLKPALSDQQLYDRITRDFALLSNHAAQGALVKLLPASMQPVMVQRWGIDPATRANQITREQKRELVRLCKHWAVPIDARGDLAHAVITAGGRAGAGGGPPDHGQQKGRRAVFCRRGAGCGRLYRRVQSADRLLHGPGVRGPSGTGYQRRKCCMIVTTTPSIEGMRITEYKGVVCGEVISGVNFVRDIAASFTNFLGGRSGSYEDELIGARQSAMEEMQQRAAAMGANAVVGVDIDYEVLGADNGMLMVTVSGTAVVAE